MDLTYPLPVPTGDGEPDSWSAVLDEAGEDRAAYEQALRLTWEHDDGYDPLLGEIAVGADVVKSPLSAQLHARPTRNLRSYL